MNQSHNASTPKIVGGIVIAAILLIGVYTLILHKEDSVALSSNTASSQTATAPTVSQDTSTVTTVPAQAPVATSSDTTASNSTTTAATPFKDGTYSETVSYRVPGDTNSLSAKVTVKDGVISSVTTDSQYGDRESSRYISGFESGINSAVKGKTLADVFVGRIGGASLTSSAFNDIIDAVKTDAQA